MFTMPVTHQMTLLRLHQRPWNLAERTVKAFERSYVSLEVKSSMEVAARIFHMEHALEGY
ncbi:hypothetical protein XH81_16405 [Bradyrhizobium sp. CCBAU 25360]|nr:hypothetical protein [Bradyrhizobium sp. CCBAU 25360]